MMAGDNNPQDVEDTGHEWDNIRELKNEPPQWWTIGLYLSGLFLFGYIALYPAIPLVTDYTRGLLGWTQIKEYNEGLGEVIAIRAPFEKKIASMDVAAILKDPEMVRYAQVAAKVPFGDNCAACHGSGGQGTPGFPVLADDDWLYGGSIDTIVETITDGREGDMPAFGPDLSTEEIEQLVAYVTAISNGKQHAAGRAVFMGETKGEAPCVDCHGEDAKGMHDMGSANLTDKIWRFGGSADDIRRTITHGVNQDGPMTRKAKMPTFGEKLSKDEIKKLAVKVWSLGGGGQ